MNEENELVLPFLKDDPVFANGVEIGMLYMRMKQGGEDEIDGYFHTENQEQITLMANRLGWTIEGMEQWSEGPEWTQIRMIRQ